MEGIISCNEFIRSLSSFGKRAFQIGGIVDEGDGGRINFSIFPTYKQDLRTDSTYSRGARPCAPTNGGLTENLRKS